MKTTSAISVRIEKVMLTFVVVLATCSLANAQLPQDIVTKIPTGYTVRSVTRGNLDDDKYEDYILVLKPNNEDLYLQDEVVRKRVLWILRGTKNLRWDIIKQSSCAIYHFGYDANFPDCFVEISIAKETFTIEHYGGFQHRWSRSTQFKYNAKRKDWLLVSDTMTIMDAVDTDSVSSEQQHTGARPGIGVEAFNIYTP